MWQVELKDFLKNNPGEINNIYRIYEKVEKGQKYIHSNFLSDLRDHYQQLLDACPYECLRPYLKMLTSIGQARFENVSADIITTRLAEEIKEFYYVCYQFGKNEYYFLPTE